MPPIRYYTVTQEREVKLSASSALEAAQIATAAFNNPAYLNEIQETDLPEGHITREIRERDLVVREDY